MVRRGPTVRVRHRAPRLTCIRGAFRSDAVRPLWHRDGLRGRPDADLVRRAILARLCLAADPDVLWPFRGNLGVDSLLSDDETGRAGAQAGPTSLRLLEFSSAAAPSREAVDFLTPHDEEDRARRQPPQEGSPPPGAAQEAGP
jgi:hypothetical protein